MSRSHRACTPSRALVSGAVHGAVRLAELEVQAHVGDGWPLSGARALARTCRLAVPGALAALLLIVSPAVSLGEVGSRAQQKRPARSSLSVRGDFARTPLLTLGTGYGTPNGSTAVRALQRRLLRAGYAPGPIDGRYGPRTEHAVIGFQANHGLQVDGIAGRQTSRALASSLPVLYPGSGYLPDGSGPVRALQRSLASAGYAAGPVDGRYGPLTEQGVMRFQASHTLPVDGIAGPRTLERLVRGKNSRPRRHRARRLHAGRNHDRPRSLGSRQRGRRAQPSSDRTPPRAHTRHVAGSSSLAWLLLIGLVLVLMVRVVWWGTRVRRHRRISSPPRAADGLKRGAANPVPPHPDRKSALAETACPDPAQAMDAAGFAQLERLSEQLRSEAAFRRADERGYATAAFELGLLLEDRGDYVQAKAAYECAEECGMPAAACNLGVLLAREGDVAGAERAFRRADQGGDAVGTLNLATLLNDGGDFAGARAAYQRAHERGTPELSRTARTALAALGSRNVQPRGRPPRGDHGGS
jgi:peptidoglycan hydrolase-like protein with peptidoglycan-binding domain